MERLRHIICLLVLLSGFNAYTQQNEALPWDAGRRLSWSDFRANPPSDSPVAATTASGVSYRFSAMEEGEKIQVDCNVETFFYPESSWYRPESANANILSHEQLHFDISELFARKMKRSIDRHHFSSEVKSEIREIYLEIIEEMRAFQNRYDQETNYSRSVEKQEEWNRMIAAALRENRD